MKPLENRTWFVLLSILVSGLLMLSLWVSAGLQISLSTGAIFLFATLGLWQGVSKLLALLLIKASPALGVIK
jgi:hypothetical protein